jgi:hypothetical protein
MTSFGAVALFIAVVVQESWWQMPDAHISLQLLMLQVD